MTHLLEGSLASGQDIRCPGCGHLNPTGLARCERCTGPLNAPAGYYDPGPPQPSGRPAVVFVFVGLLLLLAVVALGVSTFGRDDVNWPVPVVAAVICVLIAQGVWRLREWARLTAIFLLGLSLLSVPSV